MNKILLHSLTFPPDSVSTGMIVSEIAEELNHKLQNIEVLASSPQYNNLKKQDLDLKNLKSYNKQYKSFRVNYLVSNQRSFNNTKRLSQWLIFNFKAIKFIYKNRKNYKKILIFSYPPTMNLVCIFCSKILKIETVYSVWELYPEISDKLNKTKFKFVSSIFKIIDNYALNSVQSVVVNSLELKNYLIENRRIPQSKLHVIHHFSPNTRNKELPNLNLKTIIYTGNIGSPQNLEAFIKFFKSAFPRDWKLKIFGSGEMYESICKLRNENIEVLPYVERTELEELIKDYPFALVSLDQEITFEGFPGKTFDYLAMNKIIVNFSNSQSAVSNFVTQYGLGFNLNPKVEKSVESFLAQSQDLESLKRKFKNIDIYLTKFSNKEIVSNQYLNLII